MYNPTGGTDIMDQCIGNYTTKFRTVRWSLNAFCFLLDTGRVNAQTVYHLLRGENVRESDSFEFGKMLVKALITPLVERREALSQKSLPKKILAKMSITLDRPLKGPEKRDAPSSLGSFPSYLSKEEKQRCYMCKLDGKPNNKMGFVQTQCCACAKGACKDHHHILCKPCAKSFIDGARDEARATELRT